MSAFPGDLEAVGSQMGGETPHVALVLGSGLDSVVEALDDRTDIPYAEIEGMRGPSAVAGHSGMLSLGRSNGHSVVCFRGRLHCYQGVSAYDAAYTARLSAALGVELFFVTNAAGSVDPAIGAGELMLIVDQMNLTGDSPLVGWPGPEGGTPFVPMGQAYDPELADMARAVAKDLGVSLAEGVYAGLLGPAYETPAEVRYLQGIGANAVGMSTVPEVIAARALGMRVLGISMITNMAGGGHLSHSEVLEAGRRGGHDLARLLSAILRRL